VKFNSHLYFGTLSLVPVPTETELPGLTRTALQNLRYGLLASSQAAARPDQPPRPVPERVGEPSLIRHVIYIIQENRTYDQVLGDLPQGNGDPSLCIFGDQVTPNHHKGRSGLRPAGQHVLLWHLQRRMDISGRTAPSSPITWSGRSPASRAAILMAD